MQLFGFRRRFPVCWLGALLALTLPGCVHGAGLAGKASETWTHTYPLAEGGEVRIVNGNGKIDVEGVDGSTLEVRAERIAYAGTDSAAHDVLSRIAIEESVTPDFVSVQTQRPSGLWIGVRFEVRYYVKAPRTATVRVTTTNGGIELSALNGSVIANTTNGGVLGKQLGGGIQARTTNGGIDLQLSAVGADRVDATATNGGIRMELPDTTKATISASCTNGGVAVSGHNLDVGEQSRKRFEGRLNGGGTRITLRTTNGGIVLSTRS